MADDLDRGKLRRAVEGPEGKRARWPGISVEFKADAVQALRVALRWSLEKQDNRAVQGIVKTLAMLEGQNQRDDHHDEEMAKPGQTVNNFVQLKLVDREHWEAL